MTTLKEIINNNGGICEAAIRDNLTKELGLFVSRYEQNQDDEGVQQVIIWLNYFLS